VRWHDERVDGPRLTLACVLSGGIIRALLDRGHWMLGSCRCKARGLRLSNCANSRRLLLRNLRNTTLELRAKVRRDPLQGSRLQTRRKHFLRKGEMRIVAIGRPSVGGIVVRAHEPFE